MFRFGGGSWEEVGSDISAPEGRMVYALAMHPYNPNTLGRGVFRNDLILKEP